MQRLGRVYTRRLCNPLTSSNAASRSRTAVREGSRLTAGWAWGQAPVPGSRPLHGTVALSARNRGNSSHTESTSRLHGLTQELRLAVLIDGDNAQPSVLSGVLQEAGKFGTLSVKRLYHDFTRETSRSWKEDMSMHAILPVQQFAFTHGKNATDSALIIDAMDLLHGGGLEGFCLVSSDSDFTRLASRLRESGKLVVGFGERKTPQAFVHSCDRFVFTEVLRKTHRSKSPKSSKADAPKKAPFPIKKEAVAIAEQAEAATAASATAASDGDSESEKETDSKMEIDEVLLSILGSAVEDATDEQTGWAHLSQVRALATRSMPELDSRNYGYKRFSDLVTATGLFQFQDPSKPMFVKYLGAPAVGYND